MRSLASWHSPKRSKAISIPTVETGIFVVLAAVYMLVNPGGLTTSEMSRLLVAAAPLALAAMSQTFPIIGGGQGLSAGATVVVVAIFVCDFPVGTPHAFPRAIAACLLIGAVIGLFNGLLTGFFRCRSAAVTLSVGAAATAFALEHMNAVWLGGTSQPGLATAVPEWFTHPLFTSTLIAGSYIFGTFLLRTNFGKSLRKSGRGDRSPPWPTVILLAYVIAGVGSSIAGIYLGLSLGSLNASMGAPVLLQVLSAVALGGGVLGVTGGSVFGAMLGAFIVVLTENLLLPLSIGDYLSSAFDGGWALIGLALSVGFRTQNRLNPPVLAATGRRTFWCSALAAIAAPPLVLLLLFHSTSDLVTAAAGLTLLAVGQTALLQRGLIDLSVPGLASATSVAVIAFSRASDANLVLIILAIMVAAVVVGLFLGELAVRFGRASSLATLAFGGLMQAGTMGLLYAFPGGYVAPTIQKLTTSHLGGATSAAWIMMVLAIICGFVVDGSGMAHNQDRGIRTSYLVSACAAATFGLFLAGASGSADFHLIDTNVFPALAAALIASALAGQSNLGARIAIPTASIIVLIDTFLVTEGIGYSGRIITLSALVIAIETIRTNVRFGNLRWSK